MQANGRSFACNGEGRGWSWFVGDPNPKGDQVELLFAFDIAAGAGATASLLTLFLPQGEKKCQIEFLANKAERQRDREGER